MGKAYLRRGGQDLRGLYLHTHKFFYPLQGGDWVQVARTEIKDMDMQQWVAAHYGRYSLVGTFCRPGQTLLDFPCGSGYGAHFLSAYGVQYEGRDNDAPTVGYAQSLYSGPRSSFMEGDLRQPDLEPQRYDVIACVGGLECLEKEAQAAVIPAFKKALKRGGTLVATMTESSMEHDAPSRTNPYDVWRRTRGSFLALLGEYFDPFRIGILTIPMPYLAGRMHTCLAAICHKR